ncbi:MAG TPA: YggS family pyridoxal phosphate-dependent enzyme [Flavobacteriaceae bacterium]|nr:YggS family pyridoxal phosphate-dependent enzyme [Flavobacteriaceae bacterium]
MDTLAIKQNLQQIQDRINGACALANRKPEEVKLLLATKTVAAEKIQIAIDQGYHLLGENKILEGLDKYEVLKQNDCKWHVIGHAQTNKVKHILKYADVLQSLDRFKLALKLQNRCDFDNRDIDVFIQVNTSYEKSKFGVAPEKAIQLIKDVSELPRLHIKGLMTIGILSSKDDRVRDCFKLLKEIQQEAIALKLPNASFEELSMGMSNDLELAIFEGSTMVRVGTAIFGRRPYPDSYYWNEN